MTNFLKTFLNKIEALFHNPKVEAAFNTVAEVLVVAEPIVAEIAELVPATTPAGMIVVKVLAAYAKYAVTPIATITADPASTGAALLQLATTLVAAKVKSPTATNIIQTAVQIAVTASKAA